MIKEAIQEEMINELDRLNLKELGGVQGSEGTQTSQATTGTSGTAQAQQAKGTMGTKPGNDDPANNVMVPGTNMSINQGLTAASKEMNFKKKSELINKISAQLTGMKGVVVKEGPVDEPEMPGKKKVNTRDPMFPDLIRRIANLVYYGDKSDEEVLADLGNAVDGVNVSDRWVRFMANMVRKGKDVMEESKKVK
jgi:hypothetical protein